MIIYVVSLYGKSSKSFVITLLDFNEYKKDCLLCFFKLFFTPSHFFMLLVIVLLSLKLVLENQLLLHPNIHSYLAIYEALDFVALEFRIRVFIMLL